MKKFKVTCDGVESIGTSSYQDAAIHRALWHLNDLKTGETKTITVERLPFTKHDKQENRHRKAPKQGIYVGQKVLTPTGYGTVKEIREADGVIEECARVQIDGDRDKAGDILINESDVVVGIIESVAQHPYSTETVIKRPDGSPVELSGTNLCNLSREVRLSNQLKIGQQYAEASEVQVSTGKDADDRDKLSELGL